MRVRIKEIGKENPNNLVLFSTDFGDAKAIWEGEEPTINNEYQVEVDINETLIWNIDIIRVENGYYSIQIENDIIHISGSLDSLDDDGYAILKIGESIIPFMAMGEPFQVGSFIKLATKIVSVSPISY